MTSPIPAAEPEQHFETYAEFYRGSAYAAFPHKHRAGGFFGLTGMTSEQSPIDFIDAPVPELIFCRSDTEAGEVLVDSGDGAHLRHCMSLNELVVYPANTRRVRGLQARINKHNYVCRSLRSATRWRGPISVLTVRLSHLGYRALLPCQFPLPA